MAQENKYTVDTTLVHGKYGWMFVLSHDVYVGRSLITYGEYSELEVQALRHFARGGEVVDCGANIGALTLPLALVADRVLAVEPQITCAKLIEASCAINGIGNVRVFNGCLGNETRDDVLVPVSDYSVDNNYGNLALARFTKGRPTSMRRLDEFIFDKLTLVKIDVEGMELDVLKGGAENIKEHKPTLMVECDQEDKAGELIEYVYSIDYEPYWYINLLYNKNNYYEVEENVFNNQASINLLCVPAGSTITGLVKAMPGDTVYGSGVKSLITGVESGQK